MDKVHAASPSRRFGPDAEAPGEPSALSAGMAAAHRGRRVMSVPPVCPLERAFGCHVACRAGGCTFYRVPEVVTECAIQHWAPSVSRQPALAAWFLARRDCGVS